jgi:hypothetical protein
LRRFYLPIKIDPDQVHASLQDGILKIVAAKVAAATPKPAGTDGSERRKRLSRRVLAVLHRNHKDGVCEVHRVAVPVFQGEGELVAVSHLRDVVGLDIGGDAENESAHGEVYNRAEYGEST